MTIAEMIGETPAMMRACGEVMRTEFMLNQRVEHKSAGIEIYVDMLAEYRKLVAFLVTGDMELIRS